MTEVELLAELESLRTEVIGLQHKIQMQEGELVGLRRREVSWEREVARLRVRLGLDERGDLTVEVVA